MIELTQAPLTLTFDLFANRNDVLAFVTTRVGGESSDHLASCNIGISEFEPASDQQHEKAYNDNLPKPLDNQKPHCQQVNPEHRFPYSG